MRRGLLCLVLFLGAPLALAANLGDIYRQALLNDPVYAAARESYRAGLEALPQGRAGLLPSLNLSANYRASNTESNASGLDREFSSNPYGYTLSLVQPLYRKQNLDTYEQAKLRVLLAEQQLKLAEQDLLLRTAQAYFDVLSAEDTLSAAESAKQAFAEQLAQARRSFEVGAATIVDSHEAQARYDLATAQEIAARNDLDVKRRALEKIINAPAPGLARLREGAKVGLPEPNEMDAWVRQAQDGSLGVILGQTAMEIAGREVERQRGGHYPTLDLTASYSDSRNTSTTLGGSDATTKTGVVGVELGLPLYQGGLTSSRVREAVANREKARFDLDNARRQAILDARQGYLGVLSGVAKLGLEVGVRTRVDVLNAEQQLFTTRRDLAVARYQTLVAGLQLKAASGILGEADLGGIDGLLKD